MSLEIGSFFYWGNLKQNSYDIIRRCKYDSWLDWFYRRDQGRIRQFWDSWLIWYNIIEIEWFYHKALSSWNLELEESEELSYFVPCLFHELGGKDGKIAIFMKKTPFKNNI